MRTEETHAEFAAGHGSVNQVAAQLSTLAIPAYKHVKVKADLTNSNNIYVGHSSAVSATNGFLLDAGEEVTIHVDRLNKIWVVGGADSQGYSWLVV